LDSEDYLFLGYKVKDDEEDFMWDDLLLFTVTKRSGVWKIGPGE